MRLISIIVLLFLCSPVFAEETKWVNSLSDGIRQSEEQGLPVFVYFTMDDCTYCKMMEQNTLPKQPIISALKKFIPVKLKVGVNDEDIENFEISGYPAVSVIRSRKVAIMKFGYRSVNELLTILNGNNQPIR